MKTKIFFRLAMTVAVILTFSIFSSCTKDDEPVTPPTPEEPPVENVDKSEILSKSRTKYTPLSDNEEAVVFAANASIKLKVTKDGQTEEKNYSTEVKTILKHIKGEQSVKNFALGDPVVTFTHKKLGEGNKEQGVFTKIDSVLNINVAFGVDNFVFDADIVYQVATFNDGFSKDTLDYFKINKSKIIIRDPQLGQPYNETVEGKTFTCVRYQQNIVLYNIEGYDATLKVDKILKKELGPDATPSAAEMVAGSEQINIIRSEASFLVYNVKMKVKQTFPSGRTEIIDVAAENLETYIEVMDLTNKDVADKNISRVSDNIENVSDELQREVNAYVSSYNKKRKHTVKYNYFDVSTELFETYAKYKDDGGNIVMFPKLVYDNLTDSFVMTKTATNNGKDEYSFKYSITGSINGSTQSTSKTIKVTTPAE